MNIILEYLCYIFTKTLELLLTELLTYLLTYLLSHPDLGFSRENAVFKPFTVSRL